MMNKVLQIARREYLETVKTKAFVIGVLILPILMIVLVYFGGKIQKEAYIGPRDDRQIAVLLRDSSLDSFLRDAFGNYNEENPQRKLVPHFLDFTEEHGKKVVRANEFDALLVVDDNTVGGNSRARLFSKASSDLTLEPAIRRILNAAVSTARYTQNNLSPELIRQLSRGVGLEDIRLDQQSEGKIDKGWGVMLPMVFTMLIFFGIIASSQGLLSSIIEDKNNRVIEVMLSAVSPTEMMAGKILAHSGIGLTLIALYALGGILAVTIAGFGEMLQTIGAGRIAVLIPNMILGFLLFNSMFAAAGSAVNSIKEAQNFISPLMLTIMLPMFLSGMLTQQPDGTIATVLSLVPPVSPLVMVMRAAAMPAIPWLEVAISLVLLAGAVIGVVWTAARIFRVGILMYGKVPTVREIARWVRQA